MCTPKKTTAERQLVREKGSQKEPQPLRGARWRRAFPARGQKTRRDQVTQQHGHLHPLFSQSTVHDCARLRKP